ncbi:helix-turn-helix domain-containing protein [Rhizobium lentis]|uniref:helix-turn-helix domain-containing protein n=1 Tax=Rhizobium lentis TaxID=1138194 RepID=UPI0035C89C8D
MDSVDRNWDYHRCRRRFPFPAGPRQFSRTFQAEVGVGPAKAVELLRVEEARRRLETTRVPVEVLALDVGFGDPERMPRAFLRKYGTPPQAFRRGKTTLF